jgi:flagellar hook protein FlgE
MDAMAISVSGLKASAAQFEASASNAVRPSLPLTSGGSSGSNSAPPPPLSMSGLDFGADLVGMTMALANYRANLAVIGAESRMTKATIDLIG